MNIQRTQKRIVFYVLLPALVVYLGLRLFAQYRHVDVYVSRQAPMPAELASGLHVEEHRIDRTVTIESPYDSATDKILTMAEIGQLRSSIAWSRAMPAFIDSLSIQSPTRVLARRTTRRVILEYQLVRRGDQWLIGSATRNEIGRRAAQSD
jgi:hypothetical protein